MNKTKLLLTFVSLLLTSTPAFPGGGLQITVVAEIVENACSIRPGDETINVNFDNITNRYLLSNQRTPSKEFILHLDECDSSIAKSVRVTFNGIPSQDPQLLSLSSGSLAQGIAIGFEYNNQLQPINSQGIPITLLNGSNELKFSTFVKLLSPEPSKLNIGSFSSTANFSLAYD